MESGGEARLDRAAFGGGGCRGRWHVVVFLVALPGDVASGERVLVVWVVVVMMGMRTYVCHAAGCAVCRVVVLFGTRQVAARACVGAALVVVAFCLGGFMASRLIAGAVVFRRQIAREMGEIAGYVR